MVVLPYPFINLTSSPQDCKCVLIIERKWDLVAWGHLALEIFISPVKLHTMDTVP